MPPSQALNPTQVRVLDWIRSGCPAGTYTSGYSHRVTARALASRGLVKISGHGDSWRAELTEAGRRWSRDAADLRPGAAPPRRANATLQVDARRASSPARDVVGGEDLVRDVVEAGGELDLPAEADVDAYRKAVRASLGSPSRPRGKRLELAAMGAWPKQRHVVRLTDYLEDLVDEQAVAVPEHVGRYHQLVRRYRDAKDWQYVSRDHLPRACRILQTIVTEAHRRTWVVTAGAGLEEHTGYVERGTRPAHLSITTGNDESYTVRIEEEPAKGAQRAMAPSPYAVRRPPAWILRRQYEFIPTGRLGLDVGGLRDVSVGTILRDGKRLPLEDLLPRLFFAIEVEDMYRQRRHEIAERERSERQARWEAAMATAKQRYHDDRLWERLVAQATTWRELGAIREYLVAAGDIGELDDVERQTVLQDLRAFVDSRDPRSTLHGLRSGIPEPRPEDLKPYLGGFSPYGPN